MPRQEAAGTEIGLRVRGVGLLRVQLTQPAVAGTSLQVGPAQGAKGGQQALRVIAVPPKASRHTGKRLRVTLWPVYRHGPKVTLHARIIAGRGVLSAIAVNGSRRVVFLVKRTGSMVTFTAKLAAGRWSIVVSCKPAEGFRGSGVIRARVSIPHGTH